MAGNFVPADVPDDQRERYLENMRKATSDTGRMNLFACDQKIEHLNDDFYGAEIPASSNDPEHLFMIARQAHDAGTLGVLAGQLGLIASYATDHPNLPYLVKLNSKTNLVNTSQADPISLALDDVSSAVFLAESGVNVVGVGYTVYLGSEHEAVMLAEASRAIREAHRHGMISVLWMYPRGKAVADEKNPQLISGAAGVACCLGADFTKVNQPASFGDMDQFESLGVAVEAAGRTGVICSGGSRKPVKDFLDDLWHQVNVAGCRGAATGRNIHQKPLDEAVRMCAACHAIICGGSSVEEGLAIYHGK